MHPVKPKMTFRQKVGILIITGSTGAFIWQAYHNAKTASKFADNGWDALINAVGGLGVELFVASAAVGLLILRREGSISSGIATKGLIGLCLAFGFIAAAQSTGTTRTERSAVRAIESQSVTGATTDLARAREELAKMASVPSLATAQGALDRLKARKGWAETNGCANPSGYPVLCKQVADAQGAIGSAQRKEALEARVSTLQNKVDTGPKTALAEGDILAATASKSFGIDQINVQMLLAFFQACVFMFLAMGGWHLGLMVYGLDEDEIIRKASDPIPANSNVRPFRQANTSQTIVVDNRDPRIEAALNELTGNKKSAA